MSTSTGGLLRAILDELSAVRAVLELRGRERTLLSRSDAATAMSISLRTFQKYVQPDVPFVQIGHRILFRPRDLEDWADSKKESWHLEVRRRR